MNARQGEVVTGVAIRGNQLIPTQENVPSLLQESLVVQSIREEAIIGRLNLIVASKYVVFATV